MRDLGTDDRIGSQVEIYGHTCYLQGTAEYLLNHTNTGKKLGEKLEVVGIVTDDIEEQDRLEDYSATPQPEKSWIVPYQFAYKGQHITQLSHNIPSTFRKLPKGDLDGRKKGKAETENQIVDLAHTLGADVILSDHLMFLMETIHHRFPTVNIHPAVTHAESPYCRRGKYPTMDTLRDANKTGKTQTGATLHFVNAAFDDGMPIAFTDGVVIKATMTPTEARLRNYRLGKNPVTLHGLMHLANHFETLCTAQLG